MSYRAAKISFDGSHYIATTRRKIFRRGTSDDGQSFRQHLKRSETKGSIVKPPTRRARSFPAKSAKRICGKPWRKLSPTRNSGKNTSRGTMNVKRPTRYAERCAYPKK